MAGKPHDNAPRRRVAVIGTGFGGSVIARRLVDSGQFDVTVFERGRRYDDRDPAGRFGRLGAAERGIDQDLAGLLWAGDQGVWDARSLGGIDVVQAAGYGGGSLVYGSVHLRAPDDAFDRWYGVDADSLAPYYDDAEAMLGVELIPETVVAALPKSTAFEAAVAEQNRASFRLPLAMAFERPDGRGFAACTSCGECVVGCRIGAKKTLDLTYLAGLDAHARATVRVQHEVRQIRRFDDGGFEVEFVDRTGARGTVASLVFDEVFVCAGAVRSTELLLRSVRAGALPSLGDALGGRYSPNADSVLQVSRTSKAQKPWSGPTLTRGVVCRQTVGEGADERELWFMVQDGGVPKDFRRILAAFDTPLALACNRESRGAPAHDTPAELLPTEPRDAFERHLATFLERQFGAHETADSLAAFDRFLPPDLRALLELLFGREGWQRRSKALAAAIAAALASPDVAKAFEDEAGEHGVLGPVAALLIRHVTAFFLEMSTRADATPVMKTLGLEVVARLMAGGDPGEARREVLVGRGLLNWLAPLPSDHTAVLLAMGRDEATGRIRLDTSGRTRIDFTARPDGVYAAQVRFARQLAASMGGVLKRSPITAATGRPITVHSLGGCPMGPVGVGVVNEDGETHACPGLFVADGAVIPCSLGVNPSATIAAVAERIADRFIQRHGGPARVHAALSTVDPGLSRDPARLGGPPPRPLAPPTSMRMSERLTGSAAGCGSVGAPSVKQTLEVPLAEFEAAARLGESDGQPYVLDLELCAADLAALLRPDAAGEAARSRRLEVVTGKLTVDGATEAVRGHIELFPPRLAAPVHALMVYRLHVGAGARQFVAFKSPAHVGVIGRWPDLTTLCFELEGHGGAPRLRGVLHNTFENFLERQLATMTVGDPSVPATPADALRGTWGLLEFARFFFSHVASAYSTAPPEIRSVGEESVDP